MARWRDGEMARWRDGEMARRREGEKERSGEVEKWRSGEVEKWRSGEEIIKLSSRIFDWHGARFVDSFLESSLFMFFNMKKNRTVSFLFIV